MDKNYLLKSLPARDDVVRSNENTSGLEFEIVIKRLLFFRALVSVNEPLVREQVYATAPRARAV